MWRQLYYFPKKIKQMIHNSLRNCLFHFTPYYVTITIQGYFEGYSTALKILLFQKGSYLWIEQRQQILQCCLCF